MSDAPAVIRADVLANWHNLGAVSRVSSQYVSSQYVSSQYVTPRFAALAPSATVLVGAGDPRSSRVVYAMVIGLVVVGVALVLLGVWIMRQTRPDLEVLAPLERMGDGDWKRRDPSTQRRMLDEVRPDGAVPLTTEPMPPPIDADFEADHPVSSFSDLGPGLVAEQRDPTPVDSGAEVFEQIEPEQIEPEQIEPEQIEPEQVEPEQIQDVGDKDMDDEALSDPRG